MSTNKIIRRHRKNLKMRIVLLARYVYNNEGPDRVVKFIRQTSCGAHQAGLIYHLLQY
jgi:hypothetical protein